MYVVLYFILFLLHHRKPLENQPATNVLIQQEIKYCKTLPVDLFEYSKITLAKPANQTYEYFFTNSLAKERAVNDQKEQRLQQEISKIRYDNNQTTNTFESPSNLNYSQSIGNCSQSGHSLRLTV